MKGVKKQINDHMNGHTNGNTIPSSGDLITVLEALANPHRLRIISLLTGRRIHVSQLARESKMSRPLIYMHLKRLEGAGLVKGKLELSEDGKAKKFFEVCPFSFHLCPESIEQAITTLSSNGASDLHE